MQRDSDDKWRVKVLETHGVLALFALLAGLLSNTSALLWLGACLLALVIFAKPVASSLARGWLWFAEKLAYVNSTIVLTILYYLLLTPVAFLYRRFSTSPLNLGADHRESFYCERNHTYSGADLEKMW